MHIKKRNGNFFQSSCVINEIKKWVCEKDETKLSN